MPITPDTILNDRYRIIKILGQGGMSSVYHAIDENIGIPVAVKANLVLTDDYSRQFQREANILATLRHPNLPRVNDYFHIPGQGQYLVMDFIEGEDLRERIERLDQLSEREVIIIGAAICDALMYLHKRQPPVIHRDIKPGNIKITPEGHVVLVDFGLVKLLEGNQQTTTGARAMTPGYSPPEQYGTGRTDERSDIYSLGATLYAALTGVIPEDGLSRVTGKERLTPIRKNRPNITERLAQVVEKSLELESEKRFQSAQEFRSALLDSGNMTSIPVETNLLTPPPKRNFDKQVIHTGISQPLVSIPLSRPQSPPKKSFFKWFLPLIFAIIILGSSYYYDSRTKNISNYFENILSSNTIPIAENTNTPLITPSLVIKSSRTPLPTIVSEVPITPTIELAINATPIGGGSGLIAYASNENSEVMQIWTFDMETKKRIQLTDLADGACQPTWSPDGKSIAFISPCHSKQDIYEGARIFVLRLNNSLEISPLPIPIDPSGDFDPDWSPDGSKLVFSSLRPGNDPETKEKLVHIYIFDFVSSTYLEITDTRWKDRQPAWSPNGEYIAFVRKVAQSEIWQMDANGNNPKRFSGSSTLNLNYPAYSFDGNIIFFTMQSESGGVPFFSGLRTTNSGLPLEFRIPPLGQPDVSPAAEVDVSPDGQWFVFERWPDGTNHDIYRSPINGANVTQLFESKDFEFGPVWQPRP
ncbi:MAG: protein kinase domain-containing protein [Anaerolineaceae bacterium]